MQRIFVENALKACSKHVISCESLFTSSDAWIYIAKVC